MEAMQIKGTDKWIYVEPLESSLETAHDRQRIVLQLL